MLKVDLGDVTVVDEGSTNGTRVNGTAIARGARKPCVRATCSRSRATSFGSRWPLRWPTPPSARSLARKLLLDALGQVGGEAAPPRLLLLTGKRAGCGWEFPAAPSRLVAGRGDGCEAPLDEPDCSRAHAEFQRDPEGVVARDLGSKNGFFIADRRVTDKRVRHNDEITIGRTVLRFEDPTEELPSRAGAGPRRARAAAPTAAPSPSPLGAPACPRGARGSDGIDAARDALPGARGAVEPRRAPPDARPARQLGGLDRGGAGGGDPGRERRGAVDGAAFDPQREPPTACRATQDRDLVRVARQTTARIDTPHTAMIIRAAR